MTQSINHQQNKYQTLGLQIQAVGLACASGLSGAQVTCRAADLNQIFHAETGTTFKQMFALLEGLGILSGSGSTFNQFTKTSDLLNPTKLLGEGQLGWHLLRLAKLGYPIESVSDLLSLNREVSRLSDRASTSASLGSHSFAYDPRNASVMLNVNGRITHRFDAAVSAFDSAVVVGDGLWESFRIHRGTILFFDEHMDRLETTARGIGIRLDYSRDDYKGMLVDVLKANGMTDDTHVRFIITAGDKVTPLASRGVNYGPQNVIIIPEFKKHTEAQPLRTIRGPERRLSGDTFDPALHALSKGSDVQASNFARRAGFDEVLMQDDRGNYVAFNSTSFFLVKGDTVYVPHDRHLLRGVTRGSVLSICAEKGIEVVQKDITYFDLAEATACFATGTAGGVRPVASIDVLEHYDPRSPVIEKIRLGYEELIAREAEKGENSISDAYGFIESRRLNALQVTLRENDYKTGSILAAARSQDGAGLSSDSLSELDNALNAIRATVREANHTVRRLPEDRDREIAQFNGGTPELGFVPQMAFSERLALATRASLVSILRERGLLPDLEVKRIQLWSSPRNMSTALMRSFEQRPDTQVFDEVLYSCYLSRVGDEVKQKHPGFAEVIGALESDSERIIDQLILGPQTRSVAFFKQMTHHLFGAQLDRTFLKQTTNIILTRPPKDMVVSFSRDLLQGGVTMEDVGYQQQSILFGELKAHTGTDPIVLDSELLLANPERVLRDLCDKLNLEFVPDMLSWPQGASAYDGIWGKYWYRGVTDSTEFSTYRGYKMPEGKPELTELIERCNEHYAPLRAVALGQY